MNTDPAVLTGRWGGLDREAHWCRVGYSDLFSPGLATRLGLCPVSLEAAEVNRHFRWLMGVLLPTREEIGQELIDSGTENTVQMALS